MIFFKNVLNIFILNPLSHLWEFVYKVRRAAYEYGFIKKEYFKVPVVSIGNITFGGTGKTPLTIWLIKKLEDYGMDIAVLTRGYKGNLENSSGVIKGGQTFLSNPYEYGDEPLLISKKLKRGAVIVGKRRARNLKKYFHDIKPDVVLLDDGFQHIQLFRTYNIVLFDALLPLESYRTAPMGYLREGLSALKDADAILVSRVDQVDDEKVEALLDLLKKYHRSGIPVGKFHYIPSAIFDSFDKEILSMDELEGKNIIALSAIASPESFYNLLEKHGANIVDKVVFPDHHFFNHVDINEILIKAVRQNALVICSEKDMVKLKKVSKDPRILYVNITIKFISGEFELVNSLKKTLNLDYN